MGGAAAAAGAGAAGSITGAPYEAASPAQHPPTDADASTPLQSADASPPSQRHRSLRHDVTTTTSSSSSSSSAKRFDVVFSSTEGLGLGFQKSEAAADGSDCFLVMETRDAAERAGVRRGDTIVAFNGKRLRPGLTQKSLVRKMSRAGRPVTITFERRFGATPAPLSPDAVRSSGVSIAATPPHLQLASNQSANLRFRKRAPSGPFSPLGLPSVMERPGGSDTDQSVESVNHNLSNSTIFADGVENSQPAVNNILSLLDVAPVQNNRWG